MSAKVLCLEHIRKDFGKAKVLSDINLTVLKGEVCGLVGNNGAGKTTLLRLVAGLMKPSEGSVSLHTEKPYIGYMPQTCRFDNRQTVAQTVLFFASLRKKDEREGLVLCQKFGLEINKKVRYLSPGQQKKLLMVIAMIGDPDLYILDEPTAGLDPGATDEMGRLIKEIYNREKSIVISSHILQDMDDICTDIAIMERGMLIYNQKLESSYIVSTSPVGDVLIEHLEKKYSLKVSNKRTTLHIKTDKKGVAELVKVLTVNSVDVYEISPTNVKGIVQEHLYLRENEVMK
ncbi:ABC transporter ATP-binding protein [Acetobacterium wieringae]|uniref:ABC transporter ATP-binding protein n=1 Tax=Acetobacterium wieringae TaxID=52694 RepID=UPI0026ED80EE|nr:ABC transporter ATP-binding protein [Acetobacterium wieringae]